MKTITATQYTFSYLTEEGAVKQKFITAIDQATAYLKAKRYFEESGIFEFWYGW